MRIIRPHPTGARLGIVDPLPLSSVFSFVFSNPNIPSSQVAVIDGPTGEQLTRAEVKSRAQKLATGFTDGLGLKKGEVVTIFSRNSIHYHVMVFGAQCAGLIVSPANPAYTPSELVHQLSDSASSLLLVHPLVLPTAIKAAQEAGWDALKIETRIALAAYRSEVGEEGTSMKCLDDLWQGKEMVPVEIEDPKKTVAYIGYSSGTTGAAKGVMTSHFNMTSILSHLYVVPQNHVQMGVLPFNHIYGLTKLVHWCFLTGQPTVILPQFTLPEFCRLVDQYRISCAMIVPPIALLIAKDPEAKKWDLGSVRLVICGAAPLGKELETLLGERLRNAKMTQAYGLTETSPTTHYSPPDEPQPGTIGYLLPNQLGRIVDPSTGVDCPSGKEGEIWLKGPNVMLGYLNRPDATKEAITPDGWFKTGDIGCERNLFFYLTDRMKEIIKYKGFQVPPAELEAILLQNPAIADAAVISVYSYAQATELPRAYVVLNLECGVGKVSEGDVAEWVRERVAPHKQLRGGVEFIDVIPKSLSGKILRRVLKDKATKDGVGAAGPKL